MHVGRSILLKRAFRRRGRPTTIAPLFSLSAPTRYAPLCDLARCESGEFANSGLRRVVSSNSHKEKINFRHSLFPSAACHCLAPPCTWIMWPTVQSRNLFRELFQVRLRATKMRARALAVLLMQRRFSTLFRECMVISYPHNGANSCAPKDTAP